MASSFKACSVDGCNGDAGKKGAARGLCGKHYLRFRRYGDTAFVKQVKGVYGPECSVDGCTKPAHAHSFCSAHAGTFKKYGDPLARHPNPRRGSRARWLAEHVGHSGDECLVFPFSRNPNGRGTVTINQRGIGASRYMCVLAHGEPETDELVAAHTCGQGHNGCVNPKHLRWATHAENENDKRIHGTLRQGENINTAKLTIQQAAFVKTSKQSGVSLARQFGITPAAVSSIRTGKNWKSA